MRVPSVALLAAGIGPAVPSQSEQDERTALLAGALELDRNTASHLLEAAGWDWARMKDSLSKEQRQLLFSQEQTLRDFGKKRISEREGRPAPASKVRPPTKHAPGQQASSGITCRMYNLARQLCILPTLTLTRTHTCLSQMRWCAHRS